MSKIGKTAINIPEKVKNFIEENLAKEISHFKKKNKIEFNLISDKSLILPEYKIQLLNKNKKIIKKIENIEKSEISFIKQNNNRSLFRSNQYRKKFSGKNRFKKNYNYKTKSKKNYYENKKTVNY